MKDGHLLSQHAVSGQWTGVRDDGGDGEKRRGIRREEEAETNRKDGYVSVKRTDREREGP